MEPNTDRELILVIDNKVDNINDNIERLVKALTVLETVKFQDHEDRIKKIEKFQNQWIGVYWFVMILGGVIGLVNFIMVFLKK